MSTDAPKPNTSASTSTATLPDDPEVLKRMIRELLDTLKSTRRENEQLHHRLDQLLRKLFGPRAERYDPNQPFLFAELANTAEPAAPEPSAPADESDTEKKRRKPHGRRKLPGHLRREQRTWELSESERRCPCCGEPRASIGEEVSEQLDFVPASLFVIEHHRVKYACRKCEEHVAIAAKPPQPIDKGLPGPGLLAHVIVSKYADHLPLYRQERIFARQGVELPRQTTCGWMAQCADILRPLFECMKAEVLLSRVIHTDDSPIPVLDPGNNKTRRGHMWVYLGDRNHPYTVFDFMPNHSNTGPFNFLANFAGHLQADAHKGYDAIYAKKPILEVACWAHTRRYFYEARDTDSARGHEALARIRQLYEIEDRAKNMSDIERASLRQREARPLLKSFRTWLEEQRQGADAVLPKSPMGQAISYAFGNWEALCRYTDHGFLVIDNNASERTLREFVISRKNWLFAGSDNGGETAAVLFTFTATCRRLKVDPFAYLRDVLTRISTHPLEQFAELLPDRWARAAEIPTSTP